MDKKAIKQYHKAALEIVKSVNKVRKFQELLLVQVYLNTTPSNTVNTLCDELRTLDRWIGVAQKHENAVQVKDRVDIFAHRCAIAIGKLCFELVDAQLTLLEKGEYRRIPEQWFSGLNELRAELKAEQLDQPVQQDRKENP